MAISCFGTMSCFFGSKILFFFYYFWHFSTSSLQCVFFGLVHVESRNKLCHHWTKSACKTFEVRFSSVFTFSCYTIGNHFKKVMWWQHWCYPQKINGIRLYNHCVMVHLYWRLLMYDQNHIKTFGNPLKCVLLFQQKDLCSLLHHFDFTAKSSSISADEF